MTKRSPLTLLAVALTGAALSATLVAPVEAHPRHGGHHDPALPAQIALPTGFLPEGIAVGRGGTAYLGSRADGDLYAVNLRTGQGSVFSQGPGTGNPSVGLKVGRGRIYVAGGTAGTGRVVSARTGAILASYAFTTDASFVNDVVLTRKSAWFTDSSNAQLYRVSRSRDAARARVKVVALTGDWSQTPDVNNANGIAQSPDRRSLLVVKSDTGGLYRVNPKTGVARLVDLGGTVLTNGDGLLVRGRTLYAVQNRLNQVAVVHLNAAGTRGRLVDTLTSADLADGTSFDVPTTVAFYRGSLFLPNARFTNPSPETADYWISRLPR